MVSPPCQCSHNERPTHFGRRCRAAGPHIVSGRGSLLVPAARWPQRRCRRAAASLLKGASSQGRELHLRHAQWRLNSVRQQSGDSLRPGRELFNRAAELEWMGKLYRSEPSAVQVVVGPRSCGKSAVLNQFQAGNPDIVYIDCRNYDTRSPAQLMAELLTQALQRAPSSEFEQTERLVERLFKSGAGTENPLDNIKAAASTDGVKFQFSIGDLGALLRRLLVGPERDATTAIVLQEIRALVEERQPKNASGGPWPMIIVDEANKLMSWRDKHPEDIESLLSFFVQISKQSQQCHIVLATSEYGFMDWLSQELDAIFCATTVIGDFGEDHAREFLHWRLRKRGEFCMLDDDAWARVYEVCGGNAGYLGRLSLELTCPINATNLDEALTSIRSWEFNCVMELAEGGDGWTRAQFAAAALRLLDSPHHAVPKAEMAALLGQYADEATRSRQGQNPAGKDALRSLVAGNALAVRPYSDLAQDIPKEAFLVEGDPTVMVTAPSAMSLYCMGRLRTKLERELANWQGQRA